tara:strand:- start:151 stop:456 length:306 start_codon:yes stop_codon:yes gene_type:complete
MEKEILNIIWLKHCINDFKHLTEEEFIFVDLKLRGILSDLIQNTSRVKGTKLRRLRIGDKRLFLRKIENNIYCVGYKTRGNAYSKKQLKEMDKRIRKIFLN